MERRRPVPDAGRGVAGDDRRALPGRRLDPPARRHARRAATRGAPSAACRRFDACVDGAAGAVDDARRAGRSLLYEGYALYPYTPGRDEERDADAVRDRLPAGVRASSAGDVRPRPAAVPRRGRPSDARLSATLRFLQPSGERHEAVERRVELGPVGVGERSSVDVRRRPLHAALRARSTDGGCARVARACTTRPSVRRRARPRRGARRSSCSPPTSSSQVAGGRFISPARERRLRERQHLPGAGHARTTTRCSARRSCCPTTRSSRPRAAATCSTTPRSRRRCCSTCTRSPTRSARRSPSRTRPCARCSSAPRPRRREDIARACTGASIRSETTPPSAARLADMPGEDERHGRRRHRSRAATTSCCGPAPTATPTTACSTGRPRDGRADLSTTTTACTSASRSTTTPASELMRDTGRYLYFFANEVEVLRMTSDDRAREADPRRRRRQRLAAGRRLRRRGRQAARGARAARRRAVMDFGTGGLDLAYEVMRGYDALVLVDVSRQGGEPGTLYVMEPDEDDIDGGDRGRRGDRPARHGPADRAALRQGGRRLAGQVVVIACEPGEVEDVGLRALARRSRPPSSRAVDARARDDRRAARRGVRG